MNKFKEIIIYVIWFKKIIKPVNFKMVFSYQWLMSITHNILVIFILVNHRNLQLLFLILAPIGWLLLQITVKNVKKLLTSPVILKLINLLQWNQLFKFMVVHSYQAIFTLILSVLHIKKLSQLDHCQEVLCAKRINLLKIILVLKIFNLLPWTGWKGCIKVFKEF